jgi:hypothetical protein
LGALDYNPVGITDALNYARDKVVEVLGEYNGSNPNISEHYNADKFKVFPAGANHRIVSPAR